MKPLSLALEAHLAGEVTSLCSCWKITRNDGIQICLTDHDRDLTVAGELYAASDGYDRSPLKSSGASDTDEMELSGLLRSDWLEEGDLLQGLYDFAQVDFFLVNWQDPLMGILPLRRGWIGEVSWQDGTFAAELRGLSNGFKRTVGALYSPGCRADLGDGACGVDMDALVQSASVGAVVDAACLELVDFAGDGSALVGGLLRFTSGPLAGRQVEITAYDGVAAAVRLFVPLVRPPEVGDAVLLYPGCDKRFSTCRDTYANQVNFRGFPHVPGLDGILEPDYE